MNILFILYHNDEYFDERDDENEDDNENEEEEDKFEDIPSEYWDIYIVFSKKKKKKKNQANKLPPYRPVDYKIVL